MENNYRFVMRNLVKRYIAHLQRCKQLTEGVTEEHIAEIKEDINAFRHELLGILRNAGFNTNVVDRKDETISERKKRNLMAKRRLLCGTDESMSIPLSEPLLNGTIDDDLTDEPHEVDRKERRSLPVPMPAVKFASKLRKVLPYAKARNTIIKPRFMKNSPTGFPFISRGFERNLSTLINVCSLPVDMRSSGVARLSLKSHNIRNAEDDEDLDLFVDNDEDDPIDNEKENISQDISSSESTIADRGMNRCSKNSCHFRKESICLEMGYQEQPPFKS